MKLRNFGSKKTWHTQTRERFEKPVKPKRGPQHQPKRKK
jgi:hypothetical protein